MDVFCDIICIWRQPEVLDANRMFKTCFFFIPLEKVPFFFRKIIVCFEGWAISQDVTSIDREVEKTPK